MAGAGPLEKRRPATEPRRGRRRQGRQHRPMTTPARLRSVKPRSPASTARRSRSHCPRSPIRASSLSSGAGQPRTRRVSETPPPIGGSRDLPSGGAVSSRSRWPCRLCGRPPASAPGCRPITSRGSCSTGCCRRRGCSPLPSSRRPASWRSRQRATCSFPSLAVVLGTDLLDAVGPAAMGRGPSPGLILREADLRRASH